MILRLLADKALGYFSPKLTVRQSSTLSHIENVIAAGWRTQIPSHIESIGYQENTV